MAAQVLGDVHSEADVAWALSLAHSRCFVQSGLGHVLVPGIDACNHSPEPTAGVRCVHSPEACQGAAATEEIAPPRLPEPSRFELVAGESGLTPGEEITISYGRWPSDVFLLFFGWADQRGTPGDQVVLFQDLFELRTFHQRLVHGGWGEADATGDEEERASERWAGMEERGQGGRNRKFLIGRVAKTPSPLPPDSPRLRFPFCNLVLIFSSSPPFLAFLMTSRMVISEAGIDERLLHAAQALLAIRRAEGRGPDGRPLSVPEFLAARCHEVLARYPTSAEEDAAVLEGSEGETLQSSARTAIAFRLGKKRVLRTVLAQLEGAGEVPTV
jgi:hypothetical protein